MATIEIDIDIDDYLGEASDSALKAEIERRRRRQKDWGGSPFAVHPWTPEGIADDLRTAFYARNASRLEAILSALAPKQRGH